MIFTVCGLLLYVPYPSPQIAPEASPFMNMGGTVWDPRRKPRSSEEMPQCFKNNKSASPPSRGGTRMWREVTELVENSSLLVSYVDVIRTIVAYCPVCLRHYVATVLGG